MSYDHGCQVLLQQHTTCPSWSSYLHIRVEKSNLSFSSIFIKLKFLMQSSRSLLTVTVVDNKGQVELRGSLCYHYDVDACFATAPNTLAATPLIPRMPDPTTAMTATSSLTFISFMTFPSRLSSKVVIALSRSVFLTSIEMLDSEGL